MAGSSTATLVSATVGFLSNERNAVARLSCFLTYPLVVSVVSLVLSGWAVALVVADG